MSCTTVRPFSPYAVNDFADVFLSAILAYKPRFFVGGGGYTFRTKAVFGWMPFRCNIGMLCKERFTYGATRIPSHPLCG